MFRNDQNPQKKTWEELTAAASNKTDPEELAMILEQILEALEERERTQSPAPKPPPLLRAAR